MPRGFEKFLPLRIVTVLVGLLVLLTIGGWLYIQSPIVRPQPTKINAPCKWDSEGVPQGCKDKCDQAFSSWDIQKTKIGEKVWQICCPPNYLAVQGTTTCQKVQ